MDDVRVQIGYTLACEEHGPRDLVRYARGAEEAGFDFAMISDHFHPWVERQGHSPHVWSVIGAIAAATQRLPIGTGVTCPTIRQHPAIVAQAAATCAALLPGRFLLGVGTGEALNERILGDPWPAARVRREMLREAVEVIRALWGGAQVEHRGRHYTVENARLYTLPERPPPILVAAAGPQAATLAGEIGDGFVGTAPDAELIGRYDQAGGAGKPRYGQVTVCWAESEEEAQETAYRFFANTGAPGELNTELALPRHYEQVAELLEPSDMADLLACGPDPEKVLEQVREFEQAGLDHLYFHQVGPDQEGFFRFWQEQLKPGLA